MTKEQSFEQSFHIMRPLFPAEIKKKFTFAPGEMAERLIAPVLKTGLGKTNGGSNPSLSAFFLYTVHSYCKQCTFGQFFSV
jgi:hypothetical protein